MKHLIGRIGIGAIICVLPLMSAGSHGPAPSSMVNGCTETSVQRGSTPLVPVSPRALPTLPAQPTAPPATEVTTNQQAPADSLTAARAMRARLKEPDGRTRKGLGWFIGIAGLLGSVNSALGIPYLLGGIALLWTGIRKYKRIKAERQAAVAAGAKPFVEVRGRVGRGVLLGLMASLVLVIVFTSYLFAVNGAGDWLSRMLLSSFSLYLLFLAAIIGGLLLLWRGGAYAKAMRANGFKKPRK